jgi:hypothetical protein
VERLPGIFRHALSPAVCAAPVEGFVTSDAARLRVRAEYRVWVLLYVCLLAAAAARPQAVGRPLLRYWLLPYAVGCAHLRFYQTAEHRACNERDYTNTAVWVASRTTATFWLYCRLAWNMPVRTGSVQEAPGRGN